MRLLFTIFKLMMRLCFLPVEITIRLFIFLGKSAIRPISFLFPKAQSFITEKMNIESASLPDAPEQETQTIVSPKKITKPVIATTEPVAPVKETQTIPANTPKQECAPTLLYEHNTEQVAPSLTITDSTGQRWVAKYKYYNVNIKRTTNFNEIFPCDYLDIEVKEDGCAVFSFCGNEIGTLDKTQKSEMVKDFLHRGDIVKAQVQSINEKIALRLFFFKRREEVILEQEPFTVTLTANSNDNMQCNIESCNEGDEVELEYDFDKEKYLVSTKLYEIGYIPKSKHEYVESLENNGYEFSGHIVQIKESDSGRYSVKVQIIAK